MVKVHVGESQSPVVRKLRRREAGWRATGDELAVRRMTNSIRREVAASLLGEDEA